jgi:hypothetical protein
MEHFGAGRLSTSAQHRKAMGSQLKYERYCTRLDCIFYTLARTHSHTQRRGRENLSLVSLWKGWARYIYMLIRKVSPPYGDVRPICSNLSRGWTEEGSI